MTEKHQILETITSVSRLITLVFKPHKTKIAIRDHNVILCEPVSEKFYGLSFPQGLERYLHGDSREDIYILNHVIVNFIEWYVIPYREKDRDIYNGLINMVKYLCVALKRLQITYKTGTVVGTLQYYINVLMAVIEDKFYPELLYINNKTTRNSFLDDTQDISDLLYSTIFDVDKFRKFWSDAELKSICNLFDKCFKSCNEDECDMIENKSKKKDDEISKTTGKIILPIPRCEHNAIIKGHLVGISNVLDNMDKKFRNMLEQSVKGTN
jgi:hypothetical protein